eukprot:2383301-Pleurochrysis_carterae.AAC.1
MRATHRRHVLLPLRCTLALDAPFANVFEVPFANFCGRWATPMVTTRCEKPDALPARISGSPSCLISQT